MAGVENQQGLEVERKFFRYEYKDASGALDTYALLTDKQKAGMATVYQKAFGGYPWYEVFKCDQCEEFSKTQEQCVHCGGSHFSEAYPLQELVNDYFPHMMSGYAPGVTIILEDNAEVIGFTTGGGIALGQLAKDKYKDNTEILNSIIQRTGVNPEDRVFYENETCISASLQQKGAGGRLNYERVKAANEMGFDLICGRTINQPWLKLKERQLAEFGYDFVSFNPDGDTYEVDGVRRQFFMARLNKSE